MVTITWSPLYSWQEIKINSINTEKKTAYAHFILFDSFLFTQAWTVSHLSVLLFYKLLPVNLDSFWEGLIPAVSFFLYLSCFPFSTSGDPKGVMLTHGNMIANITATYLNVKVWICISLQGVTVLPFVGTNPAIAWPGDGGLERGGLGPHSEICQQLELIAKKLFWTLQGNCGQI